MKRLIILIPIVLGLLIGISTANAQRNSDLSVSHSSASTALASYDLTWNTIDGGGGTSTGGGYTLLGTSGQPDAGLLMNGGGYTLAGGFWSAGASHYQVYLPVVLK